MTNLKVFQNTEFGAVRSLSINEDIWFVGKDICQVFGDKNHNRSIGRVDDIDRSTAEILDSMGRKQTVVLINESGLYSLLFSMQPQKANSNGVSNAYPIEVTERIERLHKFKRWVTNEVLPSIRKHGMYATDELIANPDLAIAALMALKQEREEKAKLNETVAIQNQQILEMKPKASYYDLILQNKNTVPVTQIAKDYGMSGRAFNKMLKDLGVQYKLGRTWILYQGYDDQGYTQSKTHVIDANISVMHTYWTQKGRLFLYDLLKLERELLPTIERGVNNE